MGAVSVKYKARRGANEAGSDVTDPIDFFENLLENQFDSYKPMYDSLDDDKKSAFKAIFDDSDVMQNRSTFQMWLNECDNDSELLGQAKDQLESFMMANQ